MAGAPYLGEIRMFAGNFAPRGWATCDGQTLAISQNSALFQLIGTTYGGDGQITFNLPDLQSRVPVHQGQGLGLSKYNMGATGGTEDVTLTVQQIPQHTHPATGIEVGTTDSPATAFPSSDPAGNVAQYSSKVANAQMAPTAIAPTGGSQPHNNIQPVLAVSFIIALEGIFPTQN
jgi:microcystin-dependent protein